MANDTNKSPHIIDTAGSTVLHPQTLYVKRVRWVGGTTAGHVAEVQDANGRTLWKSIANAANFIDDCGLESVFPSGYKVPTLQSGVLYVYFE